MYYLIPHCLMLTFPYSVKSLYLIRVMKKMIVLSRVVTIQPHIASNITALLSH